MIIVVFCHHFGNDINNASFVMVVSAFKFQGTIGMG